MSCGTVFVVADQFGRKEEGKQIKLRCVLSKEEHGICESPTLDWDEEELLDRLIRIQFRQAVTSVIAIRFRRTERQDPKEAGARILFTRN